MVILQKMLNKCHVPSLCGFRLGKSGAEKIAFAKRPYSSARILSGRD
jgi:hypothetical protein